MVCYKIQKNIFIKRLDIKLKKMGLIHFIKNPLAEIFNAFKVIEINYITYCIWYSNCPFFNVIGNVE